MSDNYKPSVETVRTETVSLPPGSDTVDTDAREAQVPLPLRVPISLTVYDLALAVGILERAILLTRRAGNGLHDEAGAAAITSDMFMLLGKLERALRDLRLSVGT